MHPKNLLKDGSLTSFKSSKGRLGFACRCVLLSDSFHSGTNKFDQLVSHKYTNDDRGVRGGQRFNKKLSHLALKNPIDHHFPSILPESHTQSTSPYYSLQSNNLPPYSPCPASPRMSSLPPPPPQSVLSPCTRTPNIAIY